MLSQSPGTLIIPTSEIGRFVLFTLALAGTHKPDGSLVSMQCSASVTENINSALRNLHEDHRWVWIMGDDHIWDGTVLTNMLKTMDEHPEVDVLVPLVVKRNPPWHPVIVQSLGQNSDNGIPMFETVKWEDLPKEGLLEVDAAGSAGMLIRREVIDALDDPWFYSTPDTNGRQAILNEDFTFCTHAKDKAGARIFCTVDVVLGHLGVFNVRPLFRNGQWGALTEFSTPEEQFRHMLMPVEYIYPEISQNGHEQPEEITVGG
jgi:hypothetical protein